MYEIFVIIFVLCFFLILSMYCSKLENFMGQHEFINYSYSQRKLIDEKEFLFKENLFQMKMNPEKKMLTFNEAKLKCDLEDDCLGFIVDQYNFRFRGTYCNNIIFLPKHSSKYLMFDNSYTKLDSARVSMIKHRNNDHLNNDKKYSDLTINFLHNYCKYLNISITNINDEISFNKKLNKNNEKLTLLQAVLISNAMKSCHGFYVVNTKNQITNVNTLLDIKFILENNYKIVDGINNMNNFYYLKIEYCHGDEQRNILNESKFTLINKNRDRSNTRMYIPTLDFDKFIKYDIHSNLDKCKNVNGNNYSLKNCYNEVGYYDKSGTFWKKEINNDTENSKTLNLNAYERQGKEINYGLNDLLNLLKVYNVSYDLNPITTDFFHINKYNYVVIEDVNTNTNELILQLNNMISLSVKTPIYFVSFESFSGILTITDDYKGIGILDTVQLIYDHVVIIGETYITPIKSQQLTYIEDRMNLFKNFQISFEMIIYEKLYDVSNIFTIAVDNIHTSDSYYKPWSLNLSNELVLNFQCGNQINRVNVTFPLLLFVNYHIILRVKNSIVTIIINEREYTSYSVNYQYFNTFQRLYFLLSDPNQSPAKTQLRFMKYMKID